MALTIKDLIAGVLTRMSVSGGGVGQSLGRIGLGGMFATGALPGRTGISAQVGNVIGGAISGQPIPVRIAGVFGPIPVSVAGGAGGQAGPQGGAGLQTLLKNALGGAAQGPTPVNIVGGPGGLGQVGAAAAEGLGGLAKGAIWFQIANEIADLPYKFRDMGAAALEGQRSLGQFNGQIAQSFAVLDIHRLQREIETGKENAKSIDTLSKAQDRLEDTMRPLDSAMTRTGNYIKAWADDQGRTISLLTSATWDMTIGALFPSLETGLFKPKKIDENEPLMPLAEMARDLAEGKWHKPILPPVKPIAEPPK